MCYLQSLSNRSMRHLYLITKTRHYSLEFHSSYSCQNCRFPTRDVRNQYINGGNASTSSCDGRWVVVVVSYQSAPQGDTEFSSSSRLASHWKPVRTTNPGHFGGSSRRHVSSINICGLLDGDGECYVTFCVVLRSVTCYVTSIS